MKIIMKIATCAIFLFAVTSLATSMPLDDNLGAQQNCCQPGQPCWPSSEEVAALANVLGNATIHRSLVWNGPGTNWPAPYAKGDNSRQPLLGHGARLDALYVQPDSELYHKPNTTCDVPGHMSEYCYQSTRDRPEEHWTPAFIVWPTTVAHLQASLKFANSHNLCLSVAGTGHSYLNRHTNNRGMMIRTTLMKGITFDANDKRGPQGTFRVQAGVNFAELYQRATEENRVVAGGHCATVGIVGWSFGGGHGPSAPSIGLGVQQIVEVEMVNANGELITVNAEQNSDLFRAVRGGGGSTWGLVSAMTIKAHEYPKTGFYKIYAELPFCGNATGLQNFYGVMHKTLDVAQTLDKNWSGSFSPKSVHGPSACQGSDMPLVFKVNYVYRGSNMTELKRVQDVLGLEAVHYSSFYNMTVPNDNEPIYAFGKHSTTDLTKELGGLPSVLINRTVVASGKYFDYLKSFTMSKISKGQSFDIIVSQDITGNIGSPQASSDEVSITNAFRTSLFHMFFLWMDNEDAAPTYSLGENSYMGESAYVMTDWKKRLFGENYSFLDSVKQKYDPKNVFWCRHCIGSDRPRSS